MGKAVLEDALQAWAKAASGVEAVWVRQKLKSTPPYLSLLLQGPKTLSGTPERWHTYDAQAPAGQEITHAYRDNEEWVLQVQAYTPKTVGDDEASALLKKLKDSLKLDGTVATLRASGISVIEVGDIQNVSVVIETEWQGRAAVALRLHTADVSTETSTFVETVDGTGEDDLAGITI